ncbi:GNAT family N-acetyltransferase [Ktedonospora formicarum]|uniref:N-acetyltransferase n=1 Tax=Ktedonospora formicarum TaxID=2778364 RepID=A0A8J3MS28_9CHLR|nr:GNAT family N-acetyltransferase [Ktedonospora formicarum]GHO45640.1 N-acetyltransferase [Ktedonospora formicarum]
MSPPASMIGLVDSQEGEALLPELINLLQDSVNSGASVGFLPPLSEQEAHQYWLDVLQKVAQKACILLVAHDAGHVTGSVQLSLASKPNASHRAEVQKLFVLQSQRRRGIGQALMQTVEQVARTHGRMLLVLDTRQSDNAERLYRRLGYQEAGIIPAYARNAEGRLDSTVFFYKIL